MDFDNFIHVTTSDRAFDVVVTHYPTYFRFTIKPHGVAGTLANIRNYAYADEAITALKNRGYEEAELLITDAMNRLEFQDAED